MRVRVLGGLAVEGVDLARLSSRKARRLLSRLAIARGAAVGVDTLAQVVWGDELPSHPADQLSVLVSRLRLALGADRLTRTQAGYTLTADWLDVVALAELAVEARRRLDAGAVATATAAARAALDLLRGPVLPEEPDETQWLEVERAEAARYAAAARLVAAEAVLASGDPWTASALAERALDAEPYDEAALAGGDVGPSGRRPAGRGPAGVRCHRRPAARRAGGGPGRGDTGFLVSILSPSESDRAYIHFVGVRPDARSSGLAQRMYEQFFELARGDRRSLVNAVTSPANDGRSPSIEGWASPCPARSATTMDPAQH